MSLTEGMTSSPVLLLKAFVWKDYALTFTRGLSGQPRQDSDTRA